MLRLIYTSTQRAVLSADELQLLCIQAAENNRSRGISGVLLHNGSEFLQCLEGEQAIVTAVYRTINQDPRHTDIILVQSVSIDQRLFDGWGMSGFMVSDTAKTALDASAYTFLDQRLTHSWRTLGVGAIALIMEYARVKDELERAGLVKLIFQG